MPTWAYGLFSTANTLRANDTRMIGGFGGKQQR
jgi:hypothetical protein